MFLSHSHDCVYLVLGATVALTREAGKNEKLAKLLTDAGVSSVEVSLGGGLSVGGGMEDRDP